jgi:hypothetical protein
MSLTYTPKLITGTSDGKYIFVTDNAHTVYTYSFCPLPYQSYTAGACSCISPMALDTDTN